ncbi:AraC family transcriptional regulator [Zophobihabitans entericus]|uniref:AraC family transcriptional regulator n=1 Tax=Zophobihabitans entericus TaxID=1635327 RepID=A0A6G9IA29_9GAMM|nr:AraC family transcriptional regulator [Zophobihabitans entericus]QIQ20584.1 AraC family transcriptional regulator [Zophobihabitans entericus]
MSKIPLYYKDDEFFNEFGTSCYINYEKMVDNFPLYRHDFIEISLILDGEGVEIINGQQYPIKKGHISVTAPWHFHTIYTPMKKEITRFICEFSMEDYLQFASVWEKSKEMLLHPNFQPCLTLNDEQFDEVCNIFNQMYKVFTSEGVNKQTKLYLKLLEFMMYFSEIQTRHANKKSAKKITGNKTNKAVLESIRYIHKHFADDISIDKVSKDVGVNTRSLNEQLIGYTGQNFTSLLTNIRIRNACILLALKAPTIKYIVSNTGFNSVQNFYRTFKNIKGITPDEYRKQHWAESEGKAGYLMQSNQVWPILYYLHKNFMNDITPEEVAQQLGMSVSNLHKIIKYNLMESFTDALREIRISYSCGLLIATDNPITQIAIEVGYNNMKAFNRAFKLQKGCPPSEYREKEHSAEEIDEYLLLIKNREE